MDLLMRQAKIEDLPTIVELLADDELGVTRETAVVNSDYINAFKAIDSDYNQYLVVVETGSEIVGTCHLTIMPSLTFAGKTRMQIEAVRVARGFRGVKIGQWMIAKAIEYGQARGAKIIQLSTNMLRPEAKLFYENLGFEATHFGMKLYLNEQG